jgi:dihydroorotate dehydrogenase electron transfer subunit
MIQQQTKILWNRPLSIDCVHLGLACEQGFEDSVPGQFVMVRVGDGSAPLLRRPFSISGLLGNPDEPGGIELLVKAVGDGTRALAQMGPGALVNLIGPLGHGFRIPKKTGRIYLAAGGIGVAPIRFLATELVKRGSRPDHLRLFLGGRSRHDLLCRDHFETLGIEVTVTTDDGSDGDQCLLTDPLEVAIAQLRPDAVFACGPHGMLVCVAGIAERLAVPCQISLETLMACGLGACLGCAVAPKKPGDPYLHACVNGPVFDSQDLVL